ncbi:hypothetical protein J3R74_002296 [Puniceicoccus vermicola]
MMRPDGLQLQAGAQLKLRPYSCTPGFQPVTRVESWKLSLLWAPGSQSLSRARAGRGKS